MKLEVKYAEGQTSELNRASELACGYDIAINDTVVLMPGEKKLICTGTAMQIEEGYYGVLAPRSSSGKLEYALANTLGYIDADYTGYVKIFLQNRGRQEFIAYPGTYLCQMVFQKFEEAEIKKVKEFSTKTVRGDGGFGSTDNKKEIV